jgi:hypothetical protein
MAELMGQLTDVATGKDPNLYWSEVVVKTPATSLASDTISAITYLAAGRWRKAIDKSTEPIGAVLKLPTEFIKGISKDVLKWHIEPEEMPEPGRLAYRLSGTLVDEDRERLLEFVERGDLSEKDLVKALVKEYKEQARKRGSKSINTKALRERIGRLKNNLRKSQ